MEITISLKAKRLNSHLKFQIIEAIGLTQTAAQAPLLQTAKNKGIDALTLPVSVDQMDLILFIFLNLI